MDFEALSKMIISGDNTGAEQWTNNALDKGVGPKEIIDKGLIPGMDEVGRRFRSNEFHMPEVLIAARAMKTSMGIVRPLVSGSEDSSAGRVVIGTVQGDLHDIGKNLVGMMLEGAGFEVVDLGVNVSPQKFVNAVEEQKPVLVGMSALLTTTMPSIGRTVEALESAELRNSVKIIVGGAPVSAAFAEQVRADGYAPDSAAAVEVARTLLGAGG